MTTDPDRLRQYAAETTPGEAAIRRVVSETMGSGTIGARSVDASAGAQRPGRPRPARSLAAGAFVGALLAGAVVAAVVLYLGAGFDQEGPPVALWSPDVERTTDAGQGIALTWRGGGELLGGRLVWESGSVSVEVPPDRGLEFAVTTREGDVRVVGTGFTVARDVLGTYVSVRHGRVGVRCKGAAEVFLGPGESRSCLPISAPSLLARARALRGASAPVAEVQETLTAGLALSGEHGVGADELHFLRAEVSSSVGDSEAATRDLDQILAAPTSARRTDALRMRAGMAVSAGACGSAGPWLEELIGGQPRAVDLVLRAECAPSTNAARADLERALTLDPDGPTAARARAGLENLAPR